MGTPRLGGKRSVWVCTVLLIPSVLAVIASRPNRADQASDPSPKESPITVNLVRQPLSDALKQLADQTGLQLVYHAADISPSQMAPAIAGTYTQDVVLTRLLDDSGLSFHHINANTVAIRVATDANNKGGHPGDDQKDRKAAGPTMRIASADDQVTRPETPEQLESTDKPSSSSSRKKDIEEIVVTGTHIAGGAPVGSPLIVISADDIVNSGYSTIGDVIRSIPQSFGGGINPGVVGTTTLNSSQNVSSASTVNLRGLGSDSTLTLVDGHRLAVDGFTSSVDIAALPLAAIERVEILTDSASAIYGSDAVAGVTNFILKKDYEGAQTIATFGEANSGTAKEYQVDQLLGKNWGSGNAMLSYEHFRQDALYASDRSFSASAAAPLTLLPYQNRDSVFGSVRQSFSESLSAYVEFLYSDRRSDIAATYPPYAFFQGTATTLSALSSGVAVNLSGGWAASIDGTLSQGKDRQVLTTVYGGSATNDPPNYYANRADSIEVHAAGPLLQLPSGPVEAAVGTGYRTEGYHDNTGSILVLRNLKYGFAELKLPIVRPDADRFGLERLELSVAGRFENYSDFGSSTTPKLAVLYAPTSDLNLRGSWGKAFRAPDLETEYGQRQLLIDPAPLLGVTSPPGAQALELYGANPSLHPETARSWSSGFDYNPNWARDLRVSLTYFDVDYRNRITQPVTSVIGALANPVFAPFVTPNPSAAVQAALVAQSNLIQNYSGAPYNPADVIAILNDRYQNAASQHAHGVDFIGDYRLHGPFGNLDLSLNAAWLTLTQVLTSTSPEQTLTGTVFYPPKFRARLGMTWQRGPWSVASFVNYVTHETDNTSTASVDVASWTTVDAQVAYDTSRWGGLFRGMRISAAFQNLFNRDPPALGLASTSIPGIGYDSTNASPLGRLVSVNVRKDW